MTLLNIGMFKSHTNKRVIVVEIVWERIVDTVYILGREGRDEGREELEREGGTEERIEEGTLWGK